MPEDSAVPLTVGLLLFPLNPPCDYFLVPLCIPDTPTPTPGLFLGSLECSPSSQSADPPTH